MVDLADGSHDRGLDEQLGMRRHPDVVNGPYTDKMVDLSVLQPYGISCRSRPRFHDVADGVP
jgi:hypothetical protein